MTSGGDAQGLSEDRVTAVAMIVGYDAMLADLLCVIAAAEL
jgi:hypothetical protein